ncbi:hypothetical protein DSM104443_01766 [Usitatibacter rugosus]|uniref:Uncharacterized protein n=1 Tax=Usitatibacter rugosus TaxID=2732067 RepID=A0A6M4GTN2_9PROT|nr:hypothetical protein [Usitatibacter rugosus]QJR10699.1 hypothetical protein DSM104443_01766 [Usitatibacter rugosus]
MNDMERRIYDNLGTVLRERFAEIEKQVNRTDRAANLIKTVEGLRIDESIAGLRSWLYTIAHKRSALVDARTSTPAPWLAELDAGGSP